MTPCICLAHSRYSVNADRWTDGLMDQQMDEWLNGWISYCPLSSKSSPSHLLPPKPEPSAAVSLLPPANDPHLWGRSGKWSCPDGGREPSGVRTNVLHDDHHCLHFQEESNTRQTLAILSGWAQPRLVPAHVLMVLGPCLPALHCPLWCWCSKDCVCLDWEGHRFWNQTNHGLNAWLSLPKLCGLEQATLLLWVSVPHPVWKNKWG